MTNLFDFLDLITLKLTFDLEIMSWKLPFLAGINILWVGCPTLIKTPQRGCYKQTDRHLAPIKQDFDAKKHTNSIS